MPEFFSGKRVAHLNDLFNELDADNEGTLDVDEIMPLLEFIMTTRFGLNEGEVTSEAIQELIKFVDEDGSEEISFSEFILLIMVIVR